MALQEDKVAAARHVAGEAVNLAIGEARQDAIAACHQIAFRQPVAARMRYLDQGIETRLQRIFAKAFGGKNARQFLRQFAARNIIQMQHCGMRRQTGENGGKRADLGPVNQMGQSVPVVFLPHVFAARLGAGDDQRVNAGHGKGVGISIKAFHARARQFAALNLGQRKQVQPHIERPGI